MPRSLAAQILAIAVLATVIPAAVSFLQAQAATGAAEDAALHQASQQAADEAGEVEDLVEAMQAQARGIERIPVFWSGEDPVRDQILASPLLATPVLNALAFYTDDLQQHGVSRYDPAIGRPPDPGRAYLREAIATGRLAVVDEPVRPPNGQDVWVLPIAVPIREPALPHRSGVLVAGLRVDQLPTIWSRTSLPEGSSTRLVDARRGRILAATEGPWSTAPQTGGVLSLTSQERIRAGERAFSVRSEDGVERLRAWQSVVGTPWIVVVDIPAEAVLGPIRASALRRAVVDVGMNAAAFALLLLLWRRVAARLPVLEAAAARWAGGEWGHRAGVDGTDELGRLGNVFDHMAERVEAAEAERTRLMEQLGQERATLEAVVGGMSDGLAFVEAGGPVRYVNARASKLLGLPPEALLGRGTEEVFALLRPAMIEPEAAWAAWQQALGRLDRRPAFEVRVAGSPPREMLFQLFPVAGVDAAAPAVGILLRDTTAERALARARAELLAMVAHDLRGPATILTGYPELLLRRELPSEERREVLRTMVDEGQRLVGLLDDFLQAQQAEVAGLVVTPQPTLLGPLLAHAAAAAGEDPLRPLVLDVPDDLPAVQADPERVQQVLANLLSNARKYSPVGGEIRLVARRRDGTVEVSVVDQGLGLPAEALPRLFERFYRVPGEARRMIKGTGLGLAICREIVEAHGGQVGAESAGPSRGARFWFTLALAPATALAGEAPAPDESWGEPTARSLRILAVDDEPAVGSAVMRLLRHGGHTVVTAASGEEALERLAREPFDVVVSDCAMGAGMDGLELARRVRRRWPHVRFVLATGSITQAASLDQGTVDAVLTKPYRPADLQRAVQAA